MAIKKAAKIRILENYFALDLTLFGKPISKVEIQEDCDVCKKALVSEYLTTKGALLGTLIEMYKLIDHSPKVINEKIEASDIQKMALESSKISIKNGKSLVQTEDARKEIKNSLVKTLTEGKQVDEVKVIKEKAYSLAIDNMLVTRVVSESKNFKELNSWSGRIIEDAYKILRDSLVETALEIQSGQKNEKETK